MLEGRTDICKMSNAEGVMLSPEAIAKERNAEIIREKVPINEIYMELAEEASELSQAALKMCRIGSQTNPTPKSREEAYANLIEEFTDVINIANLLDIPFDFKESARKLERWVSRIEESSRSKQAP